MYVAALQSSFNLDRRAHELLLNEPLAKGGGLRMRERRLVGSAAVLGSIHARFFDFGGDAEQAEQAQAAEDDDSEEGDPSELGEDGDELGEEELVASVEGASVARGPRGGIRPSVVVGGVVGVSSEADAENAPDATGTVDSEGIERVIDLELVLHQLGGAKVDEATEEASHEANPRHASGASGGDGDKASQDAVANGGHVPALGADQLLEYNDDEAAGSRGEGGVHSSTGRSLRRQVGGDEQGAARVEAVPADPEDEGSENDQHRGVARHFDELAIGRVAAAAGAKEEGSPKGSDTASHVHNAGAGKVNATSDEGGVVVGVEGREPAGPRPAPVDDDRVHETGQEEGVDQVSTELATLRNGARNNGGGGGSEDELEEPENVFVARGVFTGATLAHEEEVTAVALLSLRETNEGILAGIGNAHTPGPPDASGNAGIEQVLEEDVLDVLLAHRARLKHAESGLHEEDEYTAYEQVKCVHGGGELLERRHFDTDSWILVWIPLMFKTV